MGYNDGPVAPVQALQFAGPTRSLVYASYNPEPFANLYTVAPSGGAPRQLTALKPYASSPSFSGDGTKVVYVWAQYTGLTCKGCASQIRVANADGSGRRVLTTPQDCTFDSSPTWSPDGSTILFSEDACDSPGELFTVPAGGGSRHDLHLAGSNPAWGPSKIAYEGTRGGIWTANPDGSNPTKVGVGHDPAWSSTGTLAYLVGSSAVTVGQSRVNLPFASVASLAWSPDGTHLVVTARKAKNSIPDVYTVKTDGTNPIRLTKNYDATGATW
jgi:Tol biopolymer transport system component